jgi:Fe(3+) dicitrate transport protein
MAMSSAHRLRGLLAGCLVLLLALSSMPAAAQQTQVLRGHVRDAVTGTPVAGATVRATATGVRTTTDVQGAFRLPVGTTGAVEVEVTGMGFAPVRETVTAGGEDVVIALAPAPVQMPEIAVISQRGQGLARVPGSAAVVTQAEMQAIVPASGNEVLRRVPGLHVQEEEGFGLRANVGIRGLDPDRSRAVLMLEDGVPVALNPYGEPEMYYTPPMDRMERVEVVKGSGSILFGPQTVGGVINYVTPSPPASPAGSLSLTGGAGGFLRAYGTYGGTWNNVGTHLGVLRKQADDVRGLLFEVTDVTGKVAIGTGEGSGVGVKASVYDEVSNSTYVGLTEAMFAADPNQHPAPDDRLRVRRYAASATHDLALAGEARLRTTAYGYTTSRDWQRQDYGYSADGTQVVLRNSTGNRNRSFRVAGIEPRLQWTHGVFGVRSELDAGLRAQYEYAEDAHVNGATGTARTGEVRDYEVRNGRAFAAFVQNRFFLSDRVQLVPGVRAERFSYERNILRTRVRREDPQTGAVTRLPEDVDVRQGDALFEIIPGIGATWAASDRVTVFAGAHRGFAPPRVKDAIVYEDATVPAGQAIGEMVSLQLDAERSWNVEAGTRAAPLPGVTAEATVFVLDFSNQIIPPSLSSGSVAQAKLANQGETRHVGAEGALAVDFGSLAGRAWALTGQVRHTWVDARFSAERVMRDASGQEVDVNGNRLPYAPEHLTNLSLAFDHPVGVSLSVDGSFVASQFADNFETVAPLANGRNGLIPAYRVWNASGAYRVPRAGVEVFGSLKNVFDATYIASRRPEGIRAGLPRMLHLGLRTAF